MNASLRRHAISTAVGLGIISALTAVAAANGFDDFVSVFWIREAAIVGAVGYTLALFIQRALDNQAGVWRRASAFGAVAGVVVVVLALSPQLSYLNGSGVAMALVLVSMLGATLGLAALEGVRWVRGEQRSANGAV